MSVNLFISKFSLRWLDYTLLSKKKTSLRVTDCKTILQPTATEQAERLRSLLTPVPWKPFVQVENPHCSPCGNGDLWSHSFLVVVTSGPCNLIRQRRARRWGTTWHLLPGWWEPRTIYPLHGIGRWVSVLPSSVLYWVWCEDVHTGFKELFKFSFNSHKTSMWELESEGASPPHNTACFPVLVVLSPESRLHEAVSMSCNCTVSAVLVAPGHSN